MIIEYVGLPGSGKSTLRAALMSLMDVEGTSTYTREDLQQQMISKLVPLSRQGITRRVSTAIYKANLTYRALTSESTQLKFSELAHPHIARAARRLIESQMLHKEVTNLTETQNVLFDMDEGICQNFISLNVWRRLIKKQERRNYEWLNRHLEESNHVLIFLSLSNVTAVERLDHRGRPQEWPSDIPNEEILKAYEEELAIVNSLLKNEKLAVRTHEIDASIPETEWVQVAKTIAKGLGSGRQQ